jgi:hypothetical protein
MPREKPLDFNVVQTWLAAWDETELYSDAAVRHLASLIEDPYCLVVVTRGAGREAQSLVFRRRRFFNPIPPPARSDLGSRPARNIIFRWDGSRIHAGDVRDEPIIMKQGKQPCGFMEALACAHEYAKWGDERFIYTYDDSTWGNA